jgi:hypothetical protein
MTEEQLKAINENIASLREVGMALLMDDNVDKLAMAQIINDRLTDIEVELYAK